MATTSAWQTYLDTHRERFMAELFEFLRIPSVSALPDHAGDVQRAGEWVAQRLQQAGIEHTEVMPTSGHPVVYGDWLHQPDKPTVLIYGHFDTQPVDPVDLWDSPPFEPVLKDGRIYARGASDDKGNLLSPILAIEALLKTEGQLPLNVKFFFEGQEEVGSPDLPQFMADNREKFACDLVVSADGLQWAPDQGSIEVGMKGISPVQIDITGPSGDLHSGLHGGVLQNPIHALTRILDSMRSVEGRILVDGFYDDVVEVTDEERRQIALVPYDETQYMADLGVDALYGEPGYTTRERNWVRPTLEVNGIWGGFQGEGTKTVIPSLAHAKITCRLVPDQKPEAIAAAIARHVEQYAPPGVKATVTELPGRAEAYLIPADHPGNKAAVKILTKLYGREPYYTRSGGSIPVSELFLKELGAHMVGFGFSHEDEQLHAPNEFMRVEALDRGQKGYALLLKQLAEDL